MARMMTVDVGDELREFIDSLVTAHSERGYTGRTSSAA